MNDGDISEMKQDTDRVQTADAAETTTLDAAGLIAALFERLVDAQVALLQVRHGRDISAVDRTMLQLRASALLLASIPAPNLDAMRHKVLAAAVLKVEDDDASSLARRMVEFAIRQDDVRLQGQPWSAS